MKTPYDTGKVKIGCNYFPKINYHNDDQNWIQSVCLGEKVVSLEDKLIWYGVLAVLAYAIGGLLTGCGGYNLPPQTTYNYSTAPVVPIVLDSRAEQLSRQQVIQGINDCETNSMRAVVVTTKRMVGGFTSDIPIDVQCYPKRSIY
jgi:hypothetical protein